MVGRRRYGEIRQRLPELEHVRLLLSGQPGIFRVNLCMLFRIGDPMLYIHSALFQKLICRLFL